MAVPVWDALAIPNHAPPVVILDCLRAGVSLKTVAAYVAAGVAGSTTRGTGDGSRLPLLPVLVGGGGGGAAVSPHFGGVEEEEKEEEAGGGDGGGDGSLEVGGRLVDTEKKKG